VHPFPERDTLADLEDHVLAACDLPMNIEGMPHFMIATGVNAKALST